MTDPGYRHYVLIIDRSGSMNAIREEAEHGIRHFVSEQQAVPGRATLSLYQFDTVHDTVHDFTPLDQVPTYTLVPRNMTALLDACGFAITGTGEKLAAMSEHERPGKVIVLITTDGRENASREYTRDQVREMITRQHEVFGWEFSYVGANQDAFAEAGAIGIPAAAVMDYAASPAGTRSAYAGASSAAVRFSQGASASMSYTDDEREAAKDDGKA
jgi:uncharacterized protein YegL